MQETPKLQLLLLLLAASCQLLAAQSQVSCELLSPERVCKDAWPSFRFSDGCNEIVCGRDGGVSRSGRGGSCRPSGEEDQEFCRSQGVQVFSQMGNRHCENMLNPKLCRGHPIGFRYWSGCSVVTCTLQGPVAPVSRCQSSLPDGAYCQFFEEIVPKSEGPESEGPEAEGPESEGPESEGPKSEGPESEGPESEGPESEGPESEGAENADITGHVACSALAASRICRRHSVTFAYSDGCNRIRCTGDGEGVSSRMSCLPDGDSGDFCQQQEQRVLQRLRASHWRLECLSAAEVCTHSTIGQNYYDGCNRCECSHPGRAYCSRRACHAVLATDAEFQELCRKRGAGFVRPVARK